MPTARDVLATKNSAVVYTCPAGATVVEACRLLAERRVGALVVVDEREVQGLLSEREVTLAVAQARDPARTSVREVMRRDVATVPLNAPLDEVERILRSRRVRHLPVVGPLGLLGVVSQGDVARFYALRERASAEAEPPVLP